MANRSIERNFSLKRNWVLGGFTAEQSYTCPLSPGDLSALIDATLHGVYNNLSSTQVLDCKGRNHYDTLLSGIPGEAEGEVFRVGGEIATGHSTADFEWSPFEASCHSQFKEFQGNHHITHSLTHHHSTTVPDWLPWRLLGAAAPIRPRYFRLGLERFQSRFTWASFGYLPQVTDSLLLDATGSTAMIKLVIERRAWKPTEPFADFPLYANIAGALRSALSCDISSLFREDLAKATGMRTTNPFS
jgi:hypothetical protein